MKNHLYPQPYQATTGSFDDYDSVIGNEFSVNSTSAKSGAAGGDGGSNNSDDMDDMSSLGNSHFGPNSAANSPDRMNHTGAAAASTNPQPWRQQHAPMTPLTSGSPDSDTLCVGDVSVILGSAAVGSRIPYPGGDIESVGGDSLLMTSPPALETTNLGRDAAEWNPTITHGYDAGTSKYLQLGPRGDELLFGGDNAANTNHPHFTGGRDFNADADNDEEEEDTVVGFLPRGRFGQCLLIGSTMVVVGALVFAVVAILNLNSLNNNQNDSPKFNIEAATDVSDVPPTTSTPTVPPSTLAPTVPPTKKNYSPTYEPTGVTDVPTARPQKVTESPIASINNETDSPVSSDSTASPSKEPTTDEPTKSPTVVTPSPTSSAPSKAPTTAEPTSAPSKAPTTAEPTAGETETSPLNITTAPSKAPTTDAPTPSPTEAAPLSTSSPSTTPTSSPTPKPQSLLTTGTDAFDFKDINLYLVSDELYVRQEWKSNFAKMDTNKAQFLIHVGSATPRSDGCPEEAYERTATSLSFSPLVAFSLPGNNDYPDCPVPSLAWNNYTEHLLNIDEKYWPSTSAYLVKRDPARPENFAFLYRRTLFVGLNMVSNEGSEETAKRLEQNLQWLNDNVNPHKDKINVIFLTGHGRLRDLPTFRDAIIEKKKGAWKDKMVVYARRAIESQLFVDVGGVDNFHELTVGRGYPITDIHLDIISKDAPRVGYRYIDGTPSPV